MSQNDIIFDYETPHKRVLIEFTLISHTPHSHDTVNLL